MKKISLIAGLLAAWVASPSTNTLCEGFLPPNDMKIPVGDTSHIGMRNNGGITEAQYNEIMDRIQAMYGDDLQQKGKTLVIKRLWSDSTVNSSAQQNGNQWIINMYGGIARHPDVTFEGEALVACHEMGHHIGGAPKGQSFFGGAWATNEGGSDYFATLHCLREFFSQDDNAAIVAASTIDPVAKQGCESQFKTDYEVNLCKRISLAGESVSYLFQDLNKDKVKPTFGTPDPKTVSKTDDAHPATQCRMDTYLAGALCVTDLSVPVSDTDYKVASCVEGVDAIGWRPHCWFSATNTGGGGGGGGSCPIGDPATCEQLCKIMPSMCP